MAQCASSFTCMLTIDRMIRNMCGNVQIYWLLKHIILTSEIENYLLVKQEDFFTDLPFSIQQKPID